MSDWKFGRLSEVRLLGVRSELVAVVRLALLISPIDFAVIEGLRTHKRQKELVAAGASWTLDSRHLTGHAVDLAPYVGGSIRWDWPLYYQLAAAMKSAAAELKTPVNWGGHWKVRDGPHFELDRKAFP